MFITSVKVYLPQQHQTERKNECKKKKYRDLADGNASLALYFRPTQKLALKDYADLAKRCIFIYILCLFYLKYKDIIWSRSLLIPISNTDICIANKQINKYIKKTDPPNINLNILKNARYIYYTSI